MYIERNIVCDTQSKYVGECRRARVVWKIAKRRNFKSVIDTLKHRYTYTVVGKQECMRVYAIRPMACVRPFLSCIQIQVYQGTVWNHKF